MFRACLICLFTACVATLTSSCVSVSRPGVERTHYLVQAQRPATDEPPPIFDEVLAVRGVRIAPGFDSKAFITLREQGRVEADFHHQFFLPPGEMLTAQISGWIKDARVFAGVTDLGSLIAPDLILEGVAPVMALDATGATPKAVLALQFLLLASGRDGPPAVVMQRDYRGEVALSRNAPQELVRGWNEALAEILTKFETDLRQAATSSEWAVKRPVQEP